MQTVFIYRTLIKESISRFPKTIETVRRDSAGLPWSSLCLYIQPKQLLSLKQNDCGNYFLYAPCQWETTLHYNIVSHWLGAYTKWSLWLYIPYVIVISFVLVVLLSGEPDYFGRNKILSGYDLSHYQVPHCIRVFFYFVWFVFIHHNFQFYFKLCTYCNILDIYLS